jgi:hypothetical protein
LSGDTPVRKANSNANVLSIHGNGGVDGTDGASGASGALSSRATAERRARADAR